MHIKDLQNRSYKIARDHGFWDLPEYLTSKDIVNYYIPTKLMLITQELGEALDEIRSGKPLQIIYTEPNNPEKPLGFPTELADVVIRLLDLCGYLGIDLEQAIEVKEKYNISRPYKHNKTI